MTSVLLFVRWLCFGYASDNRAMAVSSRLEKRGMIRYVRFVTGLKIQRIQDKRSFYDRYAWYYIWLRMMRSRGEVRARWLGRNLSALLARGALSQLLNRGSLLEQGGVGANSNWGIAVIRIKFSYYPLLHPHLQPWMTRSPFDILTSRSSLHPTSSPI